MQGRHSSRHTAVAFVLHQAEGAGLGHQEVDAGYPCIGLLKLLPQDGPGGGGQFVHIVGVGDVGELLIEQLGDLLLRLVQGRHDDVGGGLPRQLDDELSQVRLQALDTPCLQIVVELHLLGDHGLAFDQPLYPVTLKYLVDDPVALFHRLRPVDLDAVLATALLQLLQQLGKPGQRMGADRHTPAAQAVQLLRVRKQGLAFAHQHIHGPSQVAAQGLVL